VEVVKCTRYIRGSVVLSLPPGNRVPSSKDRPFPDSSSSALALHFVLRHSRSMPPLPALAQADPIYPVETGYLEGSGYHVTPCADLQSWYLAVSQCLAGDTLDNCVNTNAVWKCCLPGCCLLRLAELLLARIQEKEFWRVSYPGYHSPTIELSHSKARARTVLHLILPMSVGTTSKLSSNR
jgi:hypothetical protein